MGGDMESAGTSVFIDLPTEILVAIFLKLDLSDLNACQQVCRRTRAVIESSCEIQYRIHLTLSGAIDGAPGGPAIADRLASLKAYQRAWQLDSVLAPHPAFSPSSFDNGHLHSLPEDLYSDGPLVTIQVGSELRISHPRSVTRCVPANEWTLGMNRVGIRLDHSASDPSQGVLAITGWDVTNFRFGVRVFFLRPDGGVVPHPLAISRVLEIPESVGVGSSSPRGVQICGDVVACTMRDRVYAYNWKTGDIVLNVATRGWICRLVDEGVVLTGQDTQLFAYSFDPHPSSHVEQVDPPHVCILQFPCHPSRRYHSFLFRIFSEAPRPATEYRGAFQDDPAHALVAITVDVPEDSGVQFRYVLCMPRVTLLSRIHTAAARPAPEVLLWEEWALENALVLRYTHIDRPSGVKVSVRTAGSRIMVALLPRFNPEHERTGPITMDLFVFHAHPLAGRTHAEREETERNLRKAAPYFTVVPPSVLARIPMRMPDEEPRALPYAVYHKSVQIGAAESATMPGPGGIGWPFKICEDGMVVMGERGIRDVEGSWKYRVAHSWTFSA